MRDQDYDEAQGIENTLDPSKKLHAKLEGLVVKL
jgi:hypothetical protein